MAFHQRRPTNSTLCFAALTSTRTPDSFLNLLRCYFTNMFLPPLWDSISHKARPLSSPASSVTGMSFTRDSGQEIPILCYPETSPEAWMAMCHLRYEAITAEPGHWWPFQRECPQINWFYSWSHWHKLMCSF